MPKHVFSFSKNAKAHCVSLDSKNVQHSLVLRKVMCIQRNSPRRRSSLLITATSRVQVGGDHGSGELTTT